MGRGRCPRTRCWWWVAQERWADRSSGAPWTKAMRCALTPLTAETFLEVSFGVAVRRQIAHHQSIIGGQNVDVNCKQFKLGSHLVSAANHLMAECCVRDTGLRTAHYQGISRAAKVTASFPGCCHIRGSPGPVGGLNAIANCANQGAQDWDALDC